MRQSEYGQSVKSSVVPPVDPVAEAVGAPPSAVPTSVTPTDASTDCIVGVIFPVLDADTLGPEEAEFEALLVADNDVCFGSEVEAAVLCSRLDDPVV